jgi:hypothetical protein
MAELSKAIEALEIGDHSEVTLDMVPPTCKDVLQVADDTASKKSFLPGFYGPLWEFNEQRIHEFARRLSALQGKGVPEGWHLIQKEPTPGVLMSMAIRYDHGLGCPGYYDQFGDGNHQRRLESTLRTMRQLYEEVTGTGFYSPDKEAYYANMAAAPEPPK